MKNLRRCSRSAGLGDCYRRRQRNIVNIYFRLVIFCQKMLVIQTRIRHFSLESLVVHSLRCEQPEQVHRDSRTDLPLLRSIVGGWPIRCMKIVGCGSSGRTRSCYQTANHPVGKNTKGDSPLEYLLETS